MQNHLILCLIFEKPSNSFLQWSHHFIILPTEYGGSVSPHRHQHLLLSILFCVFESCHRDKWKSYLTVVLICISLVACDVEHLFVSIGYNFFGDLLDSFARFSFFKKYLFIWLHRILAVTYRVFSLQHVGSSSLTRDRTWAPALGAWSLNYRTTR